MLKANSFPTLGERETIGTLGKFCKLYDNDSMNVLGLHELIKKQYKKLSDLVYISHNIPAYISDFYADFVSGDIEDLQIALAEGDKGKQDELDEQIFENDLKEQINDWATDQSEFGFVPLYAYLDEEGLVRYENVPNDQYFPQQDGSVIIATYKKDPTDSLSKALVLLTQHFRMENGKCVIDRQAWKCDEKGINTQEWSLELWNSTFGKSYQKTDTLDIDQLPFVQADNGRKMKYGYGKSDYVDIIPQLAEINERRTHISTLLLKNLDAKMVLPPTLKDDEGNVKEFDTIFAENKDNDTARYITQDVTMISDAEEHIMSQIRIISTITGVPMWALTKGSAPERVESLRIQLFSAIRKTHRKRAKLRRAVQDLIHIGFKLQGEELTADPIIKFGDVLPSDDLIAAETESTKVRSGLSSRLHSIMRLENVSEEDAQAELKQIQEEEKLAGAFDTSTPPQFPVNQNP